MPFPNLNGRPVEYTDDVVNKVNEYSLICEQEKKLPTRAGLSLYIGINKKTLWEWEKRYEQLSNALAKFDNLQEDEVLQKGLKGEYNSNIAKLILSNHGYSDKQQTENLNTNLNTEITPDDKPVEQKLQEVLERIKKIREE